MSRSSLQAKRTARRMRTGSSRIRVSGSPMVRICRWSRSPAADVVRHLAGEDVVEQPVDGEVAAAGVLLGGAEDVVLGDQQVVAVLLALGALGRLQLLQLGRVGAEGGDLHDLPAPEVD